MRDFLALFASSIALLTATTSAQLALADNATNDLSFKLVKELLPKNQTDNFVFSPSSLGVTYGMMEQAAGGKTKEQLVKLTGENFVEASSLQSSVLRQRKSAFVNLDEKAYLITGSPDKIKQDYLKRMAQVFDTQLNTGSDLNSIKDKLLSDSSRGMLKPMTTPAPVDGLILLSTVYLKAAWADPFEKKLTKPANFTCGDGAVIKTATMNKSFHQEMKHCNNTDCEILRLPYGSSDLIGATKTDAIAMYLVLPKKDSANKWLSQLTDQKFAELIKTMSGSEGTLSLPSFEVKSSNSLAPALQHNGVTDAFSRQSADFSGMTSSPCWLADISQSAKLITNEEGTVAAAETEALFPAGISFESARFNMNVSKPFVFIVREDTTGLILFEGIINKPVNSSISKVASKEAILNKVKQLSASYKAAEGVVQSGPLEYELVRLGEKLINEKDYANALKLFQLISEKSKTTSYERQIEECNRHLLSKSERQGIYARKMGALLKEYLTSNGNQSIGAHYVDLAVKQSVLNDSHDSEKTVKVKTAEFLYRKLISYEGTSLASNNNCENPDARKYLGAPTSSQPVPLEELQNRFDTYVQELKNELAVNSKSLARLKVKKNRDPKVFWCIGNIWIGGAQKCDLSGLIQAQLVLADLLLTHSRANEAVPIYQFAIANALATNHDKGLITMMTDLKKALVACSRLPDAAAIEKNLVTIRQLDKERTDLKRVISADYKPHPLLLDKIPVD